MHYVYVLYSKRLNKLYKGSTNDIKRRLKEHNSGNITFTKSGVPWILVYCQIFVNKKDALIEERYLKFGKGRDTLKIKLHNTMERWPSG